MHKYVTQDFEGDEDEQPAIDCNFDFINFPSLPVEAQICSIPRQFMEGIEFEDKDKTRSHPKCTLQKHLPNHSGTWNCDRVKGA